MREALPPSPSYALQHSRSAPLFGNAIAALRKGERAPYSRSQRPVLHCENMAADPQNAAASQANQDLARKLLDLWQDHLSALSQDPTLMAQALKLMAAYNPFQAFPQMFPGAPPGGAAPFGGSGFAPPAGFP